MTEHDLIIASHFVHKSSFPPSKSAPVLSLDIYLPIAASLTKLSKSDLTSIAIAGTSLATNGDRLISAIINSHDASGPIKASHFVVNKEVNQSLRAFTRSTQGETPYIEYWLGTSAVLGVVSLMLAALTGPRGERLHSSNLLDTSPGVLQVAFWLGRLQQSWVTTGQVFFPRNFSIDLGESICRRAGDFFVGALAFVILHEVGHNVLGHLSDREASVAAKEFAADKYAYEMLTAVEPYNISPVIVFISLSMLSDESQEVGADGYPAVSDRYRKYLEYLEQTFDRQSVRNFQMQAESLAELCFLNCCDRDRLSNWFGRARSDAGSKFRSVFVPADREMPCGDALSTETTGVPRSMRHRIW